MGGVQTTRMGFLGLAVWQVCAALVLAGTAPAWAACNRLDDKYWETVKECKSEAKVPRIPKGVSRGLSC